MRIVPAILFTALVASAFMRQPGARFVPGQSPEGGRWFKGNTHTHTTNSDGDTPPSAVARWYRAHGYRWLVLSDHNVFTNPATLDSLQDSTFRLIPGEEVTTAYRTAQIHVNALDITRVIPAPRDSTLLGTLQKTIDTIRAERAVPHVNHPNFVWSLDTTVLRKMQGDRLIEIFNGHPTVHNAGGGDWPGMEEAWDALLTGGKRIFGIAVDDAHHFQGEFAVNRANPGRGWVVVNAPSLDGHAIIQALDAGRFYASTGPVLDSIRAIGARVSLRIVPQGDFKYTTHFIGAGGRILRTDRTLTPSYTLTGTERYVRARVIDSGNRAAWTQPFFTTRFVETGR